MPVPRGLRRYAPYIALALAFLVQWALLMNVRGPTWDAAFYYSYARSLVFDQDLSIQNDLQLSYATASPDFVSRQLHGNLTSTGQVYAPFAIGSGLLWTPLIALLRLVATAGGLPAETGFEWFFTASSATLSALGGVLALFISYQLASREAGRQAAILSTLTVCFATPLIYYQFREPLYAHVSSALLNTVFVAVWWRWHEQSPDLWRGAVLGMLLALSALMRWQNVIYVVLPALSTMWGWTRLAPQKRNAALRQLLGFAVAAAVAFLLTFSPQFLVWHSHYGSWLTIPQGSDFMSWQSPFLVETLFSSFRGLLPWMPVFAFATIGLFLKALRKPRLVLPLLVLLALSLYINASSRDWFAGGGYGPRRFVGELVIFVMGYAWLLALVSGWKRWGMGIISAVALALHQWLLLRYALAEQIGGHVVSMAPAFEWVDGPLSSFFAQLASHIPDIWVDPLGIFVFPGSPLSEVLHGGRYPLAHLFSLLASALFLLGCSILLIWIGRSLGALLPSRRDP